MVINTQPFDYAKFCEQMIIWMPCQHSNAIPHRKLKVNSGHPYYRLQCPECGSVLSPQLKYSTVDEFKNRGIIIPDWNEELYNHWWVSRSDARQAIRAQFGWDNEAWWDRYDFYLASAEWRVLRKRILERDNHLCQQCLRMPATQVHHLTYQRAGHELDEDLKAVCKPCHEALHPGQQAEQGAAANP